MGFVRVFGEGFIGAVTLGQSKTGMECPREPCRWDIICVNCLIKSLHLEAPVDVGSRCCHCHCWCIVKTYVTKQKNCTLKI